MQRIFRHVLAGGLLLLGPVATEAQEACVPRFLATRGLTGPVAEYERVLEISGDLPPSTKFLHRPSNAPERQACSGGPWTHLMEEDPAPSRSVTLLPVQAGAVLNTGYPVDRNNGALWGTRGFSSSIAAGARVQWGAFSAGTRPQILYEENEEYITSGLRQRPRDWPYQQGNMPFSQLDFAESYARVDAWGFAGGISNENFWMGPGRLNSVLMGASAPGFPHVFLGTNRTHDVKIGKLGGEMVWGRLSESALFDDDPENDHRLLSLLQVDFEPAGAPGLMFGLTRVMMQRDPPPEGYFPFFNSLFGPGGQDDMDQLLGMYARWVMPESRFEWYLEWSRGDGNADMHDLIVEPDHARAYVTGFQKLFGRKDRPYRLHAEVTSLNPSLSTFHRGGGHGFWYGASSAPHGYSHRGQLLGAWIGPGGDSQTIGFDVLRSWGVGGFYLERVRRAVDTYFTVGELRYGYPLKHDVELTAGTRGTYFYRDFQVDVSAAYSHHRNRDFLPPDADELLQGYRVDTNWNLELGFSWLPDLETRTLFALPRRER